MSVLVWFSASCLQYLMLAMELLHHDEAASVSCELHLLVLSNDAPSVCVDLS